MFCVVPDKAPVSKGLMGSMFLTCTAMNMPLLAHMRKYLVCKLPDIFKEGEVRYIKLTAFIFYFSHLMPELLLYTTKPSLVPTLNVGDTWLRSLLGDYTILTASFCFCLFFVFPRPSSECKSSASNWARSSLHIPST